jgi:hypothetical protein
MREVHLSEEAAKRFEEALAEAGRHHAGGQILFTVPLGSTGGSFPQPKPARASRKPIRVYRDGFRRVVRELRLRAEAEMKRISVPRPGPLESDG